MDERTERLRDIFMDVAEDATVTESQAERRGTLAGDAGYVDERLATVIERLTDRFDVDTTLDTDARVAIVRGFYEGRDDATIADDLGVAPSAVFRARTDLHLVREADAPGVDLEALRERIADGEAPEAAARALGADEDSAQRAARVTPPQDRSRRVSHRFRSEFEEILTDADMSVRLTASAREDGLAEATEDAEVDVDF